MFIDIPRQLPWVQTNEGDTDGTIWGSRNIDLKRKPGRVLPTPKILVTTEKTSDSSFTPAEDGTVTWGATKNGMLGGFFVQPASVGTPPTLQASWEVSGTSTDTLTKSITIPSGTNQVLVVVPLAGDTVSASTNPVDTVVFNTSESLTSPSSGSKSCGNNVRVTYGNYYLAAPTQTTADVDITFIGSNPNAAAIILLFSDAKQTSTISGNFAVNTSAGGATSLNFDSGGDPVTSVSDSLFVQHSMSSQTSHVHSEYGASELFETNVGTMTYSAALLGSTVFTNPQNIVTAFCKELGTVNSVASQRWWGLSNDAVYQTTSAKGDFDVDDSGTMPSFSTGNSEGDIKAFNSKVYVAVDSNLYSRSGTTYTTVPSSLPSGYKILEKYDDRLYIASESQIDSINTSNVFATAANTLDLDTVANENLSISCMRRTSRGLWVGTYNNQGGRARMLFWDGVTQDTVEVSVEVEAGMVMAMSIKDDVPYILDNRGVLSAWNGSYFEKVSRLDLDYKQLYRFDVFSSKDRWIHHNGMQTIDGEVLMAVNTRMADTTDLQVPRTPSGVYAYNSEHGIYHKFSFTSQKDDATVTDMGQLEIVEVGAIYPLLDDEELNEGDEQSDFLVSYAYKVDNSTTNYVIAKTDRRGIDGTSTDTAAVITFPWWDSSEVTDKWEKFYAFIKPLANSTDKLVLKYRKQEFNPVEIDVTWTDRAQFTSSDSSLSEIKTNFDNDIEYEFEGLQGEGSGYITQVENIQSAGGGLYEIDLADNVVPNNPTSTAKVRLDRWNLVGELTDDESVEDYIGFNPETTATRVQFKLYLYGTNIELQRIVAKSSVEKEI